MTVAQIFRAARYFAISPTDLSKELGIEAGPGIGEAHSSWGCAFGDFDNDGDLDILVVNLNEPPVLAAQ